MLEIKNPYLKTDSRSSWTEYPEFDTFNEGAKAYHEAVVKWLDEPCTYDHSGYQVKDGIKAPIRRAHRKDCTECWKEFTGGK